MASKARRRAAATCSRQEADMHNVFIIARREYLERVRSKSFIVMTILLPVIMLGATIVPSMLMMRSSGQAKHLVVVASGNSTGELFRKQLNKSAEDRAKAVAATGMGGRSNSQENVRYQVDITTDTSQSQHDALRNKVNQKQLDGVIF